VAVPALLCLDAALEIAAVHAEPEVDGRSVDAGHVADPCDLVAVNDPIGYL